MAVGIITFVRWHYNKDLRRLCIRLHIRISPGEESSLFRQLSNVSSVHSAVPHNPPPTERYTIGRCVKVDAQGNQRHQKVKQVYQSLCSFHSKPICCKLPPRLLQSKEAICEIPRIKTRRIWGEKVKGRPTTDSPRCTHTNSEGVDDEESLLDLSKERSTTRIRGQQLHLHGNPTEDKWVNRRKG